MLIEVLKALGYIASTQKTEDKLYRDSRSYAVNPRWGMKQKAAQQINVLPIYLLFFSFFLFFYYSHRG
jgi:hypothetical protein